MEDHTKEDIEWLKKEAELHELAMQQSKDRIRTLEEELQKTLRQNLCLREALDQVTTAAELFVERVSAHERLCLMLCCQEARRVLADLHRRNRHTKIDNVEASRHQESAPRKEEAWNRMKNG